MQEKESRFITTAELEAWARSPEEGRAMSAKIDAAWKECPEGVTPDFEEYYEKTAAKHGPFKAALKDAIEEGLLPGDIVFYCDQDRCLVNMGDWHEKEHYQSAEQLARDYFKDVEVENEVGRPAWSTEKVDGNSVGARRSKEKQASTAVPITGPQAILHALKKLDLAKLETEARDAIRSKKVTKRPRAVQVLNALEGLRRNDLRPEELMITQVPVLPAAFRPYTVMGSTFTPGDANELYRDLFKVRDAYREAYDELGDEGTKEARLQLYDAVKALYGYRDPVEPKTAARGVSGFLQKVAGTSPKFGYVQRTLLSKTQDNVGRATATVDPDLGMDEVGVPREIAWKIFSPFISRRLVQQGMSPGEAVRAIKDRKEIAEKAMLAEAKVRPVLYSRAPAWHRFNSTGGWAKIVDDNSIVTNPYITTSQNLDYDGDQLNVHLPVTDDAVNDVKTKLMPSKALLTDRDYDKVASPLKHEQVLGVFSAQQRPARQTHTFTTPEEAVHATRQGRVRLSDEVIIPGIT